MFLGYTVKMLETRNGSDLCPPPPDFWNICTCIVRYLRIGSKSKHEVHLYFIRILHTEPGDSVTEDLHVSALPLGPTV